MRLFVMIILLAGGINMFTQPATTQSLSLLRSIDVQGNIFAVDEMDNIYVAGDNRIVKYNTDGSIMAEYTDNELNEISYIDAANSQRILIFGTHHSSIRFLDRNLNEIGSLIDLNTLSIGQSLIVCGSRKNGFWVYSPIMDKLFYFSFYLKQLYSSIDLRPFGAPKIDSSAIAESGGKIFLHVADTGVFMFDMYASLITVIPYKNAMSYCVYDDKIVYCIDDEVYYLNSDGTVDLKKKIPIKFKNGLIKINNNYIYILYKKKIFVFENKK